MLAQPSPGLLFPPVGRRRQSVADQKGTSLRFELLTVTHQLSPLPRNVTRSLLLLARHPDHRQFARVAFQVPRQTLTQRGRIAWIGLHPAARFINHMHAVALTKQYLHPWHKLART